MKIKYMRITALPTNGIIIQESENGHEFEQRYLSDAEFETYMKNEFPSCWNEYVAYEASADWQTSKTATKFFYHYGETREMIRKGEAFVFNK